LGENEMPFGIDFTSDKKITQFVLTFPTGVVPSTATAINVDGNTFTPTVSGTNRTVTYASAAGAIVEGPLYFDVTFTVASTVTGDISVAYTITDADGTVNGTCAIEPALAFPEGTIFTFWVHDGAEYIEIAEVNKVGPANATIPVSLITGAYDIYVTAEYFYEDETKALVSCGEIGPFTVYEELFVINQENPEVYQIQVTEANFVDPDEDYYWGKELDVKFETFGPWQDFEDLRFEVALATLDEEAFFASFEDITFTGWTRIDGNADGRRWGLLGMGQHGGISAYSASWWNTVVYSPDDYLITPQLPILDDSYSLSFWVYSGGYNDRLSVQISTTGTAAGDFTDVVYSQIETLEDWKKVTIPLTAYEGENIYVAFRHHASTNEYFIAIDAIRLYYTSARQYINIGNIPHEEDVNEYAETFTIPTFDEITEMGFNLAQDGQPFEVMVFAYQGEEEESYISGKHIDTINEFFLVNGTDDEELPFLFDQLDVYRYAITNKIELLAYTGEDIYLKFYYEADIASPNFKTLPILQVTLDNGLTYTDL